MKKVSVLFLIILLIAVGTISTYAEGEDEEIPVESPPMVWVPIETREMEIQILPGEEYDIIIDPTTGSSFTPLLRLPEQCLRAISISPEWLQKDLELKFRLLPANIAVALSEQILSAEGNETLDEIAFVVAHLSRETYSNENFYPEIITHNAELIYENEHLVPFANITEREDYTTIVYQTEEGEFELPRDMYYWYVVHPDVGDEIPTYVDPDYVYTQDPDRDRNKGTPPPEGKFWRDYFMVFNKTGSPFLPELLNGTETMLDGIKAINSWIAQSMSFTSDDERPIQPVRIYTKGIGRCGEYQDMRSSAARASLIPVVPTSNSAEDHVWNEFWMERWIHWDGMIDNPFAYEKGWGKTLSTVHNQRGDGWTWDVTDKYTETSTISAEVIDLSGDPVDGAQVEVITEMFYVEEIKRMTNFATTGPDGKVQFMVGDGRNYWGASDGGDLGKDPLNPNVAPTEIAMNTSVGEDHEIIFQFPMSADSPQINDIISSYPEYGNYRASMEFEVIDHVIRGRNEFTGDRFEKRLPGGDISFFFANQQNMQLHNLGAPFQGYHYKERTDTATVDLTLEGDDNWHAVLYNGYSQQTVKTVKFNLTIYGFMRSRFMVREEPIFELGETIDLTGVAEGSIPIDTIELMIQGETDWLPTNIQTYPEPGYSYYGWYSNIDSTGMEPGIYTAWARAVNKSVTHFSSMNFSIVDTTEPDIEFTYVTLGPYYDSGTLEIMGNADDHHRVEELVYYLDDDRTTREELPMDDGGNWSMIIELYKLEYGDHSIHFEAKDPTGNLAAEEFIFDVIEGQKPLVTIDEPKRKLYKQGDEILIEGSAVDNVGIDSLEVLVDGRKILDITSDIESTGDFEFIYDSSSSTDGIHEMMIRATDPSGNQYADTLEFELDGKSPSLDVFLFGTPSVGPDHPITVSGETEDQNGVEFLSWSVDGSEWIDISDELSGGEFEFDFGEDLNLGEGEFELQISSIDSVGNERIVKKDLYYDPDGPIVSISPLGRLYMIEDIIPLKIDLSDASGLDSVIVEADGVGEIGSFYNSVPESFDLEIDTEDMVPGEIEIRIIAEDILGNVNEETISTRVVGEMTDSDGDGMPDWWEFKFGLDMINDDSRVDSDGDGVSNINEYLGDDSKPGNDDYSDPTSKTSTPSYPKEKGFPFATLILIAGIILMVGAVVLLIVWLTKRG